MDRRELVLRQLQAAMSALETAIEVLMEEAHGEAACEHPQDARQDMATMGNPGKWRCAECGYIHDPQGESEA